MFRQISQGVAGVQEAKILRRSWKGALTGALLLGFGASAAEAATVTRVSAFEYDPVTGLLTKEIVEPDTPSLRVETSYTYDQFGNKVTTTISGQGITSRSSTATYDSTGRFPVAETNALGHTETRTFDAAFGNRLSLTGPNGLTTTWTYDGFGRQTRETRADGNGETVTYNYCTSVIGGTHNCPTYAKFVVETKPIDANGVANGPWVVSYVDPRGRVNLERTNGFASTGVNVVMSYDHLGRMTHRSRPYYSGATADWIVSTYDLLDRVVSQTDTGGGTSTWDYSGLETVVTNDKGQQRRTVVNSQGQTTHIYEADSINSNPTTFQYDASGNVIQTVDRAGNVTTATYNVRGFKTAMTDPDMGSVSYTYNVLGELLSETDAKSQTTTYTYDLLGRMLTETAPDLTTTWVYDTATKGVGKLASVSTNQNYLQTLTYDSLGRESAVTTQLGVGVSGTVSRTYDMHGRVATVTNPNGLVTRNIYTSHGYLSQIRNDATNALYWQVNAMDATNEITSQTHGNGVTTTRAYDSRGWLTDIEAKGPGSSVPNIQDLTYTFDTLGNMASRQDVNRGLIESFGYDSLNRLVSSSVNGGNLKTIAYDSIGNITSKSDVGTYTYGGAGLPVHGVTSIAGAVATTFTYDANGNMLTGNSRTYTWASYNQPLTVTRGGSTTHFAYGPGGERIKQVNGTLTTWYFAAGYLELEQDSATGDDRWLNYIHGPGGMVALVAETIDAGNVQTDVTRFYHLDHLGSIETITDDAGLFVEANAYDPWGKRRFDSNWADDPLELVTSETNRGFTSHEHLEEVALVHMNGRLYDPLIGRMISADPFVQDPTNPQNFNRYTYVLNNPLAYTDPSGFFFKKALKVLGFIARPITTVASKLFGPEIASIVNTVTGLILCGGNPACAAVNAAAGSFAIAAEQGASLGGALKAAAFSYASASIAHGIGNLAEAGSINWFEQAVLHGVSQGGLSVAQGGKFNSAFLSGSFSSLAGSALPENIDVVSGTAVAAVIGGTTSVIGGGKFANGAATGAFVYAYNHWLHSGVSAGDARSQDDHFNELFAQQEPIGSQLLKMFGVELVSVAVPAVRVARLLKGLPVGAKYAQKTFSRYFSNAGNFAGQSVDDVAAALQSGSLRLSDVPVDYIVRRGTALILNTRSAQALTRAGIPRSQWTVVNRTGNAAFEARLTGQLQRNKLTDAGTSTVRQSGGF